VQRVFLVATKDIPGGAWLTLNYAQEPGFVAVPV
jgi:hypothetical protein